MCSNKDFMPDLDEFEKKINQNTKAVIINTPNNPTGVIYSEETIKRIAKILKDKEESLGNAIYLVDDEATISKKIMSAVTDPDKIHKDDPANPDKCMVYYYHKLIKNENIETVCEECKAGTRGCVACKKELIIKINEFLTDFRSKKAYYNEHPEKVTEILKNGTASAKEEAEDTMKKVKKSMKINYFED